MISLSVRPQIGLSPNEVFQKYGGWAAVENFGIDQSWNMFSPNPPHQYFYFVYADAEFDNGTRFQLSHSRGNFYWNNGSTTVWDEPENLYHVFGNHRWFKFYEVLVNGYGSLAEVLKLEYGRWICRVVNQGRESNQMLFHYNLYLMRVTVFSDNYKSPPSKSLFWEHYCYFKTPQEGTKEGDATDYETEKEDSSLMEN